MMLFGSWQMMLPARMTEGQGSGVLHTARSPGEAASDSSSAGSSLPLETIGGAGRVRWAAAGRSCQRSGRGPSVDLIRASDELHIDSVERSDDAPDGVAGSEVVALDDSAHKAAHHVREGLGKGGGRLIGAVDDDEALVEIHADGDGGVGVLGELSSWHARRTAGRRVASR